MAQTGRRKRPEWPLKTAVCSISSLPRFYMMKPAESQMTLLVYFREDDLLGKIRSYGTLYKKRRIRYEFKRESKSVFRIL